MLNRRSMLAMVAAALSMGGASWPALAKDGDSGGSGGGGSGSGGGGGNSGSGGGGDDNDGDDHSGPGGGDDRDRDDDDDDDQKQARDARKRGQASALKEVLGSVKRRYRGKVVDVKFANRQKSPTYRIKLIDDKGRLITISVDARTQKILKATGL